MGDHFNESKSRIINRVVAPTVLIGFVLLSGASIPSCVNHDSVFSSNQLLCVTSEELRSTTVTPYLAQRIEPGRNVVWCGTFQLAWNAVIRLIGEPIRFEKPSVTVEKLNEQAFTTADLDTASYVAMAGFVRDGIYEKIPLALLTKFHGHASPHCLPERSAASRPHDIVAYSYLFKNLEFRNSFEQLDDTLRFQGKAVDSFGMGHYKPGHQRLYGQVSILEYRGPQDFIIELKSKSSGDRLILARVKPEETLGKTIETVTARIKRAAPIPMTTGDTLAVPKFNFDITREYRELTGQPLVIKNPRIAKDLSVTAAVQDIRFEMNEKGAHLLSEAHISIGCSAQLRPWPQHELVFDGPFLLMMQRVDRTVPYFAIWVANPDLLVPAE